MIKKIGVVVGIILILAAIGFGVLMFRLAGMANKIEGIQNKITNVNLAKIPDGVYSGSYGDFVIFTSLEVTVKNHRITKITIKKQDCGKGYEALATIDRIIKAQSPKVDAVTGASSSSRCIMIAVDRALR
ncbi:MAG: FMN-binding protein [Candidatus Margulisbacteria bacterium]|nr:FMN-binding protein [Candidatus Margulisiibacteriota bacterium]